jgi:hypothetical protein
MLNEFDIILFYKVVWWFSDQDINVNAKKIKVLSFLPTYIMWNMYIRMYTLYMYVNV